MYYSVTNELHTGFLLLAGTRATILRAGLVELPGKVEHKGATGRIVRGQLPISVDDGIGLVGVEDIAATQVESECTHTLQVEITLQTYVGEKASAGHAEVVVVTLRIPLE